MDQQQSYASSFDESVQVLAVRGDIDEAGGVTLRDEISKYSQDFERSITVNLSEVDYCPSLAVGVLATARRRAEEAGVELGLVAADGTIAQRVLTICGLDHQNA